MGYKIRIISYTDELNLVGANTPNVIRIAKVLIEEG